MLKVNTSDSFPGALYVASNPIEDGECCAMATAAAIGAACAAAGYPHTYRMGRLWVDCTEEQMAAICAGVIPIPTSFSNDPLTVDGAENIYGSLFQETEGSFWLTDNAVWGDEGVKVLQVIGLWSHNDIDFTVTKGGLAEAPAKIYGYVETPCGAVNAAGYEGTIQSV